MSYIYITVQNTVKHQLNLTLIEIDKNKRIYWY